MKLLYRMWFGFKTYMTSDAYMPNRIVTGEDSDYMINATDGDLS